MTAEFHSLGLAQPSPQPSSGMTSRNTRASLTSIKYFQTKKQKYFPLTLAAGALAGIFPAAQAFRKAAISSSLMSSARFSAVFPFSSSAFTSALASTRALATSPKPAAAAQWRGVLLFQSARLTSAPSLMRVLTMLTYSEVSDQSDCSASSSSPC